MGAIGQQSFDDVNIHFTAVPAGRTIAVYVPVAVYEILHVATVQFVACHDITEIHCFCFREQREKFFRHILFCNDMVQMFASPKKREGRCLVFSFFCFL